MPVSVPALSVPALFSGNFSPERNMKKVPSKTPQPECPASDNCVPDGKAGAQPSGDKNFLGALLGRNKSFFYLHCLKISPRAVAAFLALAPVHAYRYCISPMLPAHCRFTPTCSGYALEAVRVHGVGRGMLLAAGRILRCHPFCKGGHDPVPPKSPCQRKD